MSIDIKKHIRERKAFFLHKKANSKLLQCSMFSMHSEAHSYMNLCISSL